MKIVNIDWELANGRCVCGCCKHHITKVYFDDGKVWIPTHSELVGLKEMMKICLLHNLQTDKHCFQAQQKVEVKKILTGF